MSDIYDMEIWRFFLFSGTPEEYLEMTHAS